VYVNAGHNSPVVRRTNGGTERLESGGLPFGILPEATFVAASVDLQPGDTLVLFTDGVVEAFNSTGAEFTDARWVYHPGSSRSFRPGNPTIPHAAGGTICRRHPPVRRHHMPGPPLQITSPLHLDLNSCAPSAGPGA